MAELFSVCLSAGLWELVHLRCGADGHHDAQIWLNSTGEPQCIHSPYFSVCTFIHSVNTHWMPAVVGRVLGAVKESRFHRHVRSGTSECLYCVGLEHFKTSSTFASVRNLLLMTRYDGTWEDEDVCYF